MLTTSIPNNRQPIATNAPLITHNSSLITSSVTLFADVEEARILEGDADPAGLPEVEVTIIRPCLSQNGLRYAPGALREAVAKFEGAAAFADHPNMLDATRAGGRSIRDIVGSYHGARYVEGRGVVARLRFLPSADWAYRIVEAVVKDRAAGHTAPPLGISADLIVLKQLTYPSRTQQASPGARRAAYDVVKVETVNSADLVFRPSAGGSFDRILEAWDPNTTQGGHMPPEASAVSPLPGEEGAGEGHGPTPAHVLEAELAAARATRVALCGELLTARLAASQLPEVAQSQVREQFAGRAFEAAALDTAITKMRDLLGAVAAGGVVRGMGQPRSQVSTGRTALENVTLALERLFGLPLPDNAAGIPKLSGIREAYQLITGDYDFSGRYDWERSVVREANEVTTAVMDSVVSNVMNKRLVADYRAQLKWWAPLVSIVDLRDMKTQTRVLLNDFAA
ncbi:MAG: hypothetical protein M0Z94_11435, partial [Dehalococcoidales bacterium]|nr:hypothetical protein [Dehalococcoidales bacterium]